MCSTALLLYIQPSSRVHCLLCQYLLSEHSHHLVRISSQLMLLQTVEVMFITTWVPANKSLGAYLLLQLGEVTFIHNYIVSS